MSDDLELGRDDEGFADGTPTGEAAIPQAPPPRQTTNWQDDPAFREQQARRDREIALAQKAAFDAQQYAANLEAQMHNRNLAGLEGEERVMYQNQLLQQRLEEVQRQRDLDAFAIQRQRDLQEISYKTGAPLNMIENASSSYEAWNLAYDWKEKNSSKESVRRREIERDADDNVDIGSSKPHGNSKAAKIQAKYDEARKAYNVKGQFEAMAEADGEGVTIKEW